MQFQPSPLSYGTPQVGADAVGVTVKTAGTTASLVSGMAVAAGGAAAIPVAGWIAAGVIGAAAGTIALVDAIKKGKVRKADAINIARQLDLPDPEKVPGYVARALRWAPVKRQKEIMQLEQQIARKKRHMSRSDVGKFFNAIVQPGVASRNIRRLEAKREILLALEEIDDNLKKPIAVPAQMSAPGSPSASSPSYVIPGILLGSAIVGAVILLWPTNEDEEEA